MRTIGLTGGIACGKSSVAGLLRRRGVPVLDADQVARNVLAPGSPGLARVVERFGAAVLQPDGSLDRKALGALVVADPRARADLEGFTHPAIWLAMESWLDGQRAAGAEVAVVEAALMVETGSYRRYDAMVVVRSRPETQVARLVATRGMEESTAVAWLATQMPMEEKARLADAVVDNDGTREQLASALDRAWHVVAGPVST